MYRDLQNHKRSDRIKWIAVFLAILLLAVAVCAMFTRGFKTINPYCWGDKHTYGDDGICINCGAEKPADEDKKGTADNGGMAMGDSVGNGIMLSSRPILREEYPNYGIMPIADGAQQLTATVTPTDADNKAIDWSVAWKNSGSTWATGKTVTDYVTVSPTSDGALTANVTCLQAFGEQVVVKATLRSDTDLSASCTVDYRKRLTGVTYKLQERGGGRTLTFGNSSSVTWSWMPSQNVANDIQNWNNFMAILTDTYSVGTVDDPIKKHTVTIEFSSALSTKLFQDGSLTYDKTAVTSVTYDFETKTDIQSSGTVQSILTQGSLFWNGDHGYIKSLFWAFSSPTNIGVFKLNSNGYSKLIVHMKACATDFVVTVKGETTSGATWSKQVNVNVLDSSLSILADSVGLSNSALIF